MLSLQSATAPLVRTAVPALGAVAARAARMMSTQLLADKYKAIKDAEPDFLECFQSFFDSAAAQHKEINPGHLAMMRTTSAVLSVRFPLEVLSVSTSRPLFRGI
jgi:hypothetical protein